MNSSEVGAGGRTPRSSGRVLFGSCLLALLLVAARVILVDELQSVYFISGWITCLFVLVAALAWWSPPSEQRLERRISLHLTLSIALIASFAVHTNFRMPGGVLDWVLTIWLVLGIVSLLLGRFLLTRKWLVCHVALSYGLAAACLFHGVHVHAHGVLAHWLMGK